MIDHSKIGAEHFSLYSWGHNLNGQLGLGHDKKIVSNPSKVLDFENVKIKKIDCSQESSLILTEDGKVFTFGSARSGNLGHDFEISGKNETIPKLVEALESFNIKDASISDFHGAVINDKGELFGWGTLTHGKLGIEKEKMEVKARRERVSNSSIIKEPYKSNYFGSETGLIDAKKIHCSFQNTYVIGILFY